MKAKSKKLSNNIVIITYVIYQKTIKSLLKSLIHLNAKITYTLSVKKSGNSFYLHKSEDRRGGWKKIKVVISRQCDYGLFQPLYFSKFSTVGILTHPKSNGMLVNKCLTTD